MRKIATTLTAIAALATITYTTAYMSAAPASSLPAQVSAQPLALELQARPDVSAPAAIPQPPPPVTAAEAVRRHALVVEIARQRRVRLQRQRAARIAAAMAAASAAAAKAATPPPPAPAPPPPSSGTLSFGQLESLWLSVGGPGNGVEVQAAEVAECESGGDPAAFNPSGASGLWQILGQVVAGDIFDPVINAENAVSKYEASGNTWDQWVCKPTS